MILSTNQSDSDATIITGFNRKKTTFQFVVAIGSAIA